jgi:hypothetical protein
MCDRFPRFAARLLVPEADEDGMMIAMTAWLLQCLLTISPQCLRWKKERI